MSQIFNILSWVLINPLWLATQTSGGTSSSSGSHPVQSLKMPFSSSFFCTLSCHSAMPLPGFELFPLQKNTADSFLRLQPFSLFTQKCLTPQEVPLPTHTGNRLALRYLQQKSLPCTSEVSFSSGKGNENHWQVTHLLFLWGTVPNFWLLTSTCKDNIEWLHMHPLGLPLRFSFVQSVNSWSITTNTTVVWAAISYFSWQFYP